MTGDSEGPAMVKAENKAEEASLGIFLKAEFPR